MNGISNFKFIPLKRQTKVPLQTGWTSKGISYDDLSHLGAIPHSINVGVLTGSSSSGLIDVDCDGPKTNDAAALIMQETGMITGRTGRPASHLFYRVEGDTSTVKFINPIDGKMIIEVRGDGCQTMFAGSVHPSGELVRFEDGNDGEPSVYDRAKLIEDVGKVATVSLLSPYWESGARHNLTLWISGLCACNAIPIDTCITIIDAMCRVMDDEEAQDRLRTVVDTYRKVENGTTIKWKGDLENIFGSVGVIATITEWLTPQAMTTSTNDYGAIQHRKQADQENVRLETDIEIAEWFVTVSGDRFIYADRENEFYRKRNGVYEPITITEIKGEVADFLKGPVFDNGRSGGDNRKSMQSVAKINAITELCKSLFRRDDSTFDKDHHLLGTMNGVLALTHNRLVATPSIVTKRLGTKYIPDAECPRFLKFLDEVLEGDAEKIAYLQRAIGYSLTGIVDGQVMFILTGKGANGKSVLLKLIGCLMGSYGGSVPSHTITIQKFGNDKTDDLASLVGKRFVVASESDANDKLAVAKIKRIVAGDPIPVRRLYGSYFELHPTFKLWFGSNELPQVSGTDYAVWRRIHVIEFTRTFEADERDPMLLDKLKVELPGILNWALNGLKDIGEMIGDFLRPPSSVRNSIDQYKSDNDNTSRFIQDRCVEDPSTFISIGDLHDNYKGWCYQNAVDPLPSNSFGKELTNLGYVVIKKSSGNCRKGLKLK